MTARQSRTMSRCRTKPFVGASLSIAQSRTSHTRRLADRHRPADRVQGQTDSLPIGINLPIGLDPNRGFADLDPRISRSGTHNDDHPIGLEAEHDARPTQSRVNNDDLTKTQRHRVTPKEPLERLRGSSLLIRNKGAKEYGAVEGTRTSTINYLYTRI